MCHIEEGVGSSHHNRGSDGEAAGVLLCECTHLTEFAVMLFHTSSANNATDDSTHQIAITDLYDTPQPILLQLYACLALMFVALGNSVYSGVILIINDNDFLRNNATAMQNIKIFNVLLMTATIAQTSYTLGQVIFGNRIDVILIIGRLKLLFVVAPVLICLRYDVDYDAIDALV